MSLASWHCLQSATPRMHTQRGADHWQWVSSPSTPLRLSCLHQGAVWKFFLYTVTINSISSHIQITIDTKYTKQCCHYLSRKCCTLSTSFFKLCSNLFHVFVFKNIPNFSFKLISQSIWGWLNTSPFNSISDCFFKKILFFQNKYNPVHCLAPHLTL